MYPSEDNTWHFYTSELQEYTNWNNGATIQNLLADIMPLFQQGLIIR